MTTLQPSTSRIAPDRFRGRTLALLGISFGHLMVLLDMTVLSVAEPDLEPSPVAGRSDAVGR